jgi:[acyl-carrier-protein] S-malonyltransferase
MTSRTALVFPAFVIDFIGCETVELEKMGIDVGEYFHRAKGECGNEILGFNIENEELRRNELLVQQATYIFSCAVSDLIKKRGLHVDIVAAYSMGIYSALYHAGSLSFDEGLRCVNEAYRLIRRELEQGEFCMGISGGLELHDIEDLMKKWAPHVFIINSNNPHTFVFSGPSAEMQSLLDAAREEGALMTRKMEVSIPYHSPYLENAAIAFDMFLKEVPVADPLIPILSSIDQRELKSPDELRAEMVKNIFRPFQWFETMKTLLSEGVKTFIECGAGEGLSKINKFIPGEYRTVNLKGLRKYFDAG